MLRRLALIAMLCACTAVASAETLYVTDSLRLALYASEEMNDKPLANLTSGAAVQLLERDASLARVRTAAGEEGWVKATYLVPEKPARPAWLSSRPSSPECAAKTPSIAARARARTNRRIS